MECLVGLCSGDGRTITIVAPLGLTKEAPESIGRWVGKQKKMLAEVE